MNIFNKKSILFGLASITMLSTSLYSEELNVANMKESQVEKTFDLNKVFFGNNSFIGQGNFEMIKPNSNESILIPMIITSKMKKIERDKNENYIVRNEVVLELRPRDKNMEKMTTELNLDLKTDKFLNILSFKEETISPDGNHTITCKQVSDKKTAIDLNVKIGHKSPKTKLECNDGTTREEFWILEKSKHQDYATIHVFREMTVKAKAGKEEKTINGKEEAKITVNENGKIFQIVSETKVPNMFNIKYFSRDILQKN